MITSKMMLPSRLSANLALRLIARQPRISTGRCLGTSQTRFETETTKLIRLRREREAKEEQTTGFDKMLQLNELHLQIMRRTETPEIRRKRNLATLKMAGLIIGFCVGVGIVSGAVFYLFMLSMGQDLMTLPTSHYIEYIAWKHRPDRIADTLEKERQKQ